ncbi:MAG: 2-oxoacid:acceptor oxidoreductase subunit alpha [Candidatus Omnitrophica bacterium]|nr:2-oxoacid:acceptor oxidoreductase subunit alpha [Candidatus Omnitrophota bacterium]
MAIVNQLSWMIGGPQGTGVDSSANLFARTCVAAGLWIYGKREYHSNIIGEHSYFQVRASDKPVGSHIDPVYLLATFEDSTAQIHAHELIPGGAFIYDPLLTKPDTLKLPLEVLRIGIDFEKIIKELAAESGEDYLKLVIMKNTIAVGASLALLELDFQYLEKALAGMFTGKKAKLVPLNLKAAEKAKAMVAAEAIQKFRYKLKANPKTPERLMINGVQASALGKLKAGCKFQTYYPITPASDESVYLEGKPEFGMLVMQAEDEIASLQLAISAGLAGVRSSTSTSGPGFCLMVEGMGWAGINEVPVVIFSYQRGGPSTGLPTRHEQGDLLFTLDAGHGEFPRIVIAPGDMEESFYDAFWAFNYAERYQMPVIVLSDKSLANNTQSILPFDESKLLIDRGLLASPEALAKSAAAGGEFKRFAFTDDGISPRPLLGQKGGIYWNTGDEHDELGHICEDPENRIRMQTKRMKKLELALREIPESQQFKFFGDPGADTTIVTWGSAKPPVLDALPVLAAKGIKVNVLQIKMMSPFPKEAVSRMLSKAKTLIDIEMNYTGQLAKLVRQETGIHIPHTVLKWTGRPMSETEIVSAVTEIVQKKSGKVVLRYGL